MSNKKYPIVVIMGYPADYGGLHGMLSIDMSMDCTLDEAYNRGEEIAMDVMEQYSEYEDMDDEEKKENATCEIFIPLEGVTLEQVNEDLEEGIFEGHTSFNDNTIFERYKSL